MPKHAKESAPKKGAAPSYSPAVQRSVDAKKASAAKSLEPSMMAKNLLDVPLQSSDAEESHTELPSGLQAGLEQLSGQSLSDVNVHYNSSRPGRIMTAAYTQGSNIYLGPGQESYLPHEAWHAVQQKQNRVRPSLQLGGSSVNLDSQMESEADTMGAQAASLAGRLPSTTQATHSAQLLGQTVSNQASAPIQGAKWGSGGGQQAPYKEEIDNPNPNYVYKSNEIDRELKKSQPSAMSEIIEPYVAEFEHGQGVSRKGQVENYKFQTWQQKFNVYTVDDRLADKTFYSATMVPTALLIAGQNGGGFDPSKGGGDLHGPQSISQFLSRGFVYFSPTQKLSVDYMDSKGVVDENDHRTSYVVFELKLPRGTEFIVDPEIPGGLRTTSAIPRENITGYSVWKNNKREPNQIIDGLLT